MSTSRPFLFREARWPAGRTPEGEAVDLISVFEGVGAFQAGKIDAARLKDAGRFRLPKLRLMLRDVYRQQYELSDGSPGPGPALQRLGPGQHARTRSPGPAGRGRILDLVARNITPRSIVTAEALDDAFALDMAMGGSTNTVLHGLAIANEAGIEYSLERINAVADRVPHLCKVSPSGQWHMDDVHRAGGVPAILNESPGRDAASAHAAPDGFRPNLRRVDRRGRGERRGGHPPFRQPALASAAGWRCCSATWRRAGR